MSRSIVIDFKRLESLKLSPNQYLYLVKLHRVGELYIKLSDAELLDLQAKKFVKIIKDGTVTVTLRQSAIDLIESLEIDSFGSMKKEKVLTKSERAIQEDLDAHLKEYRHSWKGIKLGSMGGAQACRDKLFKWLKNNLEYDMQDVLRAARIYIRSVDNYKYLQNAEYFISKVHDGVAHSNLSSFIEEDDEGDEDWTNELI
jgi:hypothetical protein